MQPTGLQILSATFHQATLLKLGWPMTIDHHLVTTQPLPNWLRGTYPYSYLPSNV